MGENTWILCQAASAADQKCWKFTLQITTRHHGDCSAWSGSVLGTLLLWYPISWWGERTDGHHFTGLPSSRYNTGTGCFVVWIFSNSWKLVRTSMKHISTLSVILQLGILSVSPGTRGCLQCSGWAAGPETAVPTWILSNSDTWHVATLDTWPH